MVVLVAGSSRSPEELPEYLFEFILLVEPMLRVVVRVRPVLRGSVLLGPVSVIVCAFVLVCQHCVGVADLIEDFFGAWN